jgi:L-lactate dehydrogenase complex protein LldE
VFAVEYPEISGPMLADRLDELATAGARLVVCNEGGCTLSLAGGAHRRGLPLRFKHIAECLAESLGLMEPER